MEIKNRIKVLRAEKDWTQKDLAEKLGVTRQTVAAIEN
ncbi:helix-turn-helix transcriptional regulator, partial [Bacillus safensis]